MLRRTWSGPVCRLAEAFLVLVLLVVPVGVGQPAGPTLSREFVFSEKDLHIERTAAGARYSLPGSLPSGVAGSPEIPALPVSFELPAGQDVAEFELRVAAERAYTPGLKPWPASMHPYDPGTPDPAIYATDRLHPSVRVEFTGVGYARGRRLAMFVVYPMTVNPSNGDVVLATRSELTVRLKPLGLNKAEPISPPSVTPEARHDDAALGFAPTDMPSAQGSAVDYVIVCPDEYLSAFQPLAEWKMKKGVRATIRTLSWIREHYPEGVDTSDRVRRFAQDAYRYWGAQWLLIGSDTDQIPVRYAWTRFFQLQYLASDLYFSALDGNWNDDGDAIFGEAPQYFNNAALGDSVDLLTDIFGGRLPAMDLASAQAMVQKIINYESNPPIASVERVLAFAEVLFPSEWNFGMRWSLDGATLADSTLQLVPETLHKCRLYENYYSWPGSFPENRESVIDSMNAGYGLWLHVGHGFRNTMAVGGEQNDERLTNEDADALINGPRTAVLYALNCASTAVDYNCISERFLANPNGGTVAVIGSTDLDFPGTSFKYQLEFFKLLYQDGYYHLGEAYHRANEPFVPLAGYLDNADRWTQFTQILLGDPEMEVWTARPKTLATSHPASLALGQTTLQVTVTSSGAPVPGARVCAYKSGDVFAVSTTNASGVATLQVRPDSEGTLSVTALKHDYVPKQTTVTVTGTATPYLVIQQLAVSDPLGNGDGVPNSGETLELTLSVVNRATSGSPAGTATLTSGSPLATVTQGTTTLLALAAGATGVAGSAFTIELSNEAEDHREIPLTVTITAGNTWNEPAFLTVQGAKTELMQMAIDDALGGNGNGILEPGETADVSLSLVNLGQGAMRGLAALLRPGSGGVAVQDSTEEIGALAAGAITTAAAFRISVAPDSTPAARLLLSDATGTFFSRAVDFVPPAPPDSLWTTNSPSSITLSWRPPASTDIAGYYVLRSSSSSGPFERINDEMDRMGYFKDEGLPALTRYYYQIATVDSSGNHSPYSYMIAGVTSVPLKPGWPVFVGSDCKLTGAAFEDLNSATTSDGSIEVVTGGSNLMALEADGREYVDGDRDAVTLGVFSKRGSTVWSTPAIADIDRDHSKEIVVQSWGDFVNAGDESLFVYDGTFSKVKPNWPRKIQNGNWGSPALGNLDADQNLEIVAVVGKFIYAWNSNGTEVRDGDGDPNTNGIFAEVDPDAFALYGSPGLANVYGDSRDEIIVAERKSTSSGTTNNQVHVYQGNGIEIPGFPKTIGYVSTASPAIANLDHTGDPEIIIATGDSVLVFHSDGSSRDRRPAVLDSLQLQQLHLA